MDGFLTYLLLCLAAFAAGIMNTLAGGGTLLTFPSLTRVISLVSANVTSTVALVPGSLAGAWGLRRDLGGTRPWLLLLLGPSLLGGLIGSLLLTRLPPSYFAIVVPWLLLTAALLYLFQPHLSKRLARPIPKLGTNTMSLPGAGLCILMAVFQLLVGIYGGYFGAGIGILMISSLSLMGLGEIHRINAVKNLLAAGINGISVFVFIWEGPIVWSYALVMAVAAILGALCGARLGRLLHKALLRWLIILLGLGLAAYYFAQQANSTAPDRPVDSSQSRPCFSQRCC
jgi:uncharacterized protein